MSGPAGELRARLAGGEVLLLDGATGTELQRRGASSPPPLWSAAALLERPDLVRDIHREYVAAGADIIVANTFRTNFRALARVGLEARGLELNRLAVQLAREAATEGGRRVFVAASVAPVEDCYSPDLVPGDDLLFDEHRQMADWLYAARPDLIWIETMNTAREAAIAASAVAGAGLAWACSFVLDERGRLLGGDSIESAVLAIAPHSPLAIGLNCVPPRGLTAALPTLRAAARVPIAAYAHIGNPDPIAGWSFSQSCTPADYAAEARCWMDAGASIVGGCCGTTPEHICELRRMLDQPQSNANRRLK